MTLLLKPILGAVCEVTVRWREMVIRLLDMTSSVVALLDLLVVMCYMNSLCK